MCDITNFLGFQMRYFLRSSRLKSIVLLLCVFLAVLGIGMRILEINPELDHQELARIKNRLSLTPHPVRNLSGAKIQRSRLPSIQQLGGRYLASQNTSKAQTLMKQLDENPEEAKSTIITISTEHEQRRAMQEVLGQVAAHGHFLREQCLKRTDMSSVTPYFRNFFYFERFGLLWCPVYKAASSSFLKTFILADGLTDKYVQNSPVEEIARNLYPKLSFTSFVTAVPSSLVLIIVQHPWTRLLSCYRDKFEQTNDLNFFSDVGTKILIHARGYPNGTSLETGVSLAKQLMDHLAFGTPLSPENPYLLPAPRPTFREFLEYVATHPTGNDHWAPAYISCAPCNTFLNYTVVKNEEFDAEIEALLEKLGLPQNLIRHYSPTNKKILFQPTEELVKRYYRDIDSALLRRLYDHYRNDFFLFDYDQDQFFPL